MANGKHSKAVNRSMPKTGWREPARARDELLKLPRGRSLTPTNEVRNIMPAKAVLGEGHLFVSKERSSSVLSSMGSEASSVPLDDIEEQPEEYDRYAEYHGAAVKMLHASVSSEEDGAFLSEDHDELDDEELLIGGKYENVEAASSPQRIPASKHRAKALREGTESIQPHPKDPTKIIVKYSCRDSAGGVYTQETVMPDVVSDPASAPNESGGIIFPDVETSKVPRTKKGSPWTPVHSTSRYSWTRGVGEQQETWRVNIFFRRLDRATHAFQDIYTNTNLLRSIDPNDRKFRTSYNKWILQFARRRDATYTQKVVRVHWSVPERRALYTSINKFCARFGIHRFGFTDECELNTKQLQLMADAVNNVPNPLRVTPRGVDAVRGQIVSAHDKTPPKNKAIYELLQKAQALRARLAGGEQIEKWEGNPKLAIALTDFPVERSVAGRGVFPLGGRKRKRTAVEVPDTESSGSELSSPPASEVGENDAIEETQPGGYEDRNWPDSGGELLFSEERGAVEEDMASSPPVKRAHTTW